MPAVLFVRSVGTYAASVGVFCLSMLCGIFCRFSGSVCGSCGTVFAVYGRFVPVGVFPYALRYAVPSVAYMARSAAWYAGFLRFSLCKQFT